MEINDSSDFGTGEGEFKMSYSAMIQKVRIIGLIYWFL